MTRLHLLFKRISIVYIVGVYCASIIFDRDDEIIYILLKLVKLIYFYEKEK